MTAEQWDARRAVVLAFVGGYVDTVGYAMLRGLFPNHLTGNLPIAALHPGRDAIPLLVMVPLWLAAVVVAAAWARTHRSTGLGPLLTAEAGLVALFLLLGVALVPDRNASTLATQTIVAAAGVCAMGAQSVVTRLGGYAFPTTMVTGTLTLLGMDIADRDQGMAVRRRMGVFSRVVAAFGVGAALAGMTTPHVRF
ncbi:MAG TPA: YoaK family protein [Acidimicrobiales bacterium]|nr:YoaK family protein [Acidimicrobiales bacterium]